MNVLSYHYYFNLKLTHTGRWSEIPLSNLLSHANGFPSAVLWKASNSTPASEKSHPVPSEPASETRILS